MGTLDGIAEAATLPLASVGTISAENQFELSLHQSAHSGLPPDGCGCNTSVEFPFTVLDDGVSVAVTVPALQCTNGKLLPKGEGTVTAVLVVLFVVRKSVARSVPVASPIAVVPTFTIAGVPVNSISSASPTVIGDATGTDRATLLRTTNNTTSTAVTVPSPFGSNFPFVHCNAGTVTATDTPSSSTVNGNSTLVLQP